MRDGTVLEQAANTSQEDAVFASGDLRQLCLENREAGQRFISDTLGWFAPGAKPDVTALSLFKLGSNIVPRNREGICTMAISMFGNRPASLCKAWFRWRSAMLRSKFETAEMPWILFNAPRSVRWSGKTRAAGWTIA